MDHHGTVIIIEDDLDDQFVLEEVFAELAYPNRRMYFSNGVMALTYLQTTPDKPFIIISDIELPMLSGLELRKKLMIDVELSLRCIPYLFFTTVLNQEAVIEAYSTSVQGFFVKPSSFVDIKYTIKTMMDYWQKCAFPK